MCGLLTNPMTVEKVLPKWDLKLMLREPARWKHAWDPELDRLEDFAAHIGERYSKHMDAGSIALGSAMGALLALSLG